MIKNDTSVYLDNLPKSCSDCRFAYEFQGDKKCQLTNMLKSQSLIISTDIYNSMRHPSCPLRSVPSDDASNKDHDEMIEAITEALNLLQEYKEIGTPEEFREALRKSQISTEVSSDKDKTAETEEGAVTQTEEGWSINITDCVQSVLKTFPYSTIQYPFLLLEPIGNVKIDISEIDNVVDFTVELLKTIAIAVVTLRPFVSPLENCKWQTGLRDYLSQYLESPFTLYDLTDVYYVSDNTEVLREFVESDFDSRVISYIAAERILDDKNR